MQEPVQQCCALELCQFVSASLSTVTWLFIVTSSACHCWASWSWSKPSWDILPSSCGVWPLVWRLNWIYIVDHINYLICDEVGSLPRSLTFRWDPFFECCITTLNHLSCSSSLVQMHCSSISFGHSNRLHAYSRYHLEAKASQQPKNITTAYKKNLTMML